MGAAGSLMRLAVDLEAPETRQALGLALAIWVAAIPVFLSPAFATGNIAPWAWSSNVALALVGFLLSPVVIGTIRAAEPLPRLWRLGLIIGAVCAVGVLHAALDVLLQRYFMGVFDSAGKVVAFVGADGRKVKPPFHFLAAINFLTLVWLHGVVAALAALSRSHWIIRRQERAIAAASLAQLEALRFQLNPHFLFNTLNALSALVVTSDNDRAERMVSRLSDFLRATLAIGPDTLVRLREELSVVEAYLDIEMMRIGPRLKRNISCPPSLADARAPGLVLLPLIERAVAGATQAIRSDPVVSVQVAHEDKARRLTITVRACPGGASVEDQADDPALAAVRQRIAAHYGALGSLTVKQTDQGFSAILAVPLPQALREGEA